MRPAPTLLLAGPPTSARMWDEVARRLGRHGPVEVRDLLDPVPSDPSVEGLAADLVAHLRAAAQPVTLVAHGLALPVALRAAVAVAGTRLVLCNGPVLHLDPVTALGARAGAVPGLLDTLLLRPGLALPWLASSAGLRRAVRNPYVMDRDTVVAICGPTLATARHRRALRAYLQSLPAALRSTPVHDGPALLVWGDEDRLYPPACVDEARRVLPRLRHHRVAGGRWLHPVERPWELADVVAEGVGAP
ncbi:hypothetical protein L6R53_08020 [Myxococcota bacterium]|nr:hypothetical protein [Myxococcota bacterium]